MTIVSRARVRAAVARALMLGASLDEAIASAAQALSLSPETVTECWNADQQEAA